MYLTKRIIDKPLLSLYRESRTSPALYRELHLKVTMVAGAHMASLAELIEVKKAGAFVASSRDYRYIVNFFAYFFKPPAKAMVLSSEANSPKWLT
ncbi:MAG TPA: hypothetical protein EYN69_10910 [Flavobacteriales bacterium]|nr:hypothetical protein [Flavobacteriales bacterium]